jgi:hypothetical protein
VHALTLALLLLDPAAAPPAASEPTITVTFPAPGKERATLTVNPDDPAGPATIFKVVVGATTQTFSHATPAAARTIEVPADPRLFVRFDVEQPGTPAAHAFARITPGSRPLLIPDACGGWDLATSGSSAAAACFARDRHCPIASHPSADRRLTETQCGRGTQKFCVPDYRIDVVGEKGQKVRAGVDNDLGHWILLRGPGQTRHLNFPSGGRCPGVTVESGTDRARLSLGWGQRVRVRVLLDGQLSAEDLPAEAHAESSGGGGD